MKNISFALLVVLVISIMGCKTDEEFTGPALNDLYGAFSVLQPLASSNYDIDLSTGQNMYFTASFSKNVDWKLSIKGLQSGALKEITGFSNTLDAVNAAWNGTVTKLPMFKIETCAVELTFEAETDTLRDTINVSASRAITGLILSDFESGTNAGWNSFVQSGTDMSFSVQNSPLAAQGNSYFDIGGIVDWDWLIGLINMPASAYGNPTFQLSSNPNLEFFNVMLYKPELLNNGIMLFQFMEDDNGDGVYTTNSEDMFSIQIPMTQNGWNLYSSKYADLATLVNGSPAAAIGNGVHEPNKLFQVSMLFLADKTSGYANAYVDCITFTNGGPLVP